MLTIKTTISVYVGLGLVGGLTIKRPVYGISYGIGSALMTIALGILFGPQGYYASIGIQTIALCSKIARCAQVNAPIHKANKQDLKTLLDLSRNWLH